MEEIWKNVKEIEDIEEECFVSNFGNIKKYEKNITPNTNNKGYLSISLLIKKTYNIRRTFMVHRLVAKSFIPNPENKPQINHKNLLKSDNRVDNLEWVTNKENIIHLFSNSEKRIQKLTMEQVNSIRDDLKKYKAKFLSKKYEVSYQTILNIKNNKTWKFLK